MVSPAVWVVASGWGDDEMVGPRRSCEGSERCAMTMSEDEQHILNEIETFTRSADPGFAANLNLVAAQARRQKRLALSRYGFWLGFVILMVGAGSARGPISAGVTRRLVWTDPHGVGNGHAQRNRVRRERRLPAVLDPGNTENG